MDSLDFFKSKKVFVTGHTGFKGSWMIQWLSMLGAEIKGYALAPPQDIDLYNTIQGDTLCDSIIANIMDFQRLQKEVEDFQPDIIFHMAAQPLVRYSYQEPLETFNTNVIGTANILETLKSVRKTCACVVITTDKVYENKEWHYPYRESDRLGGYDPYSASKACAELVVSSYRNSFFHPSQYSVHQKSIASARAGNVIGGGDWSENRIIPDIIRSLQSDTPIVLRNPSSIRPWQHVLEPVGGYIQLAEKLYHSPEVYGHSWNFGPEDTDTYTVEELTKLGIKLWGNGSYESQVDVHAPHEAKLLKLDISQAKNELHWKPKLNSEKAIEWTIDFYKSNAPQQIIKEQINRYQSI